jgi:hypothetical protein
MMHAARLSAFCNTKPTRHCLLLVNTKAHVKSTQAHTPLFHARDSFSNTCVSSHVGSVLRLIDLSTQFAHLNNKTLS